MDYDKLKGDVKEIAEIASSLPEKFRDKCFELLLTHLLAGHAQRPDTNRIASPDKETPPANPLEAPGNAIPVTTALRVLMQKTQITKEELDKVILYDDGQVHFIRAPHDTGITTGQMEWALLLALKNAIENNSLSTDPEQVRSVCQEKGFYDRKNFAATFKAERNARLFKTALIVQGPSEPLSNAGQEALGALVKRLAGDNR
jgi:hypothetical protein